MKLWNGIKDVVSTWVGKIEWTSKKVLHEDEVEIIRQKLKDNYYVIATRHNGHLSSYFIAFAHWVLTGRPGYYAHVLINAENEVKGDEDYRFIEATGKGVHYSGFSEVFDQQCSSVALLKPKSMSIEEWTEALDKARTELGKPYDTIFDLSNDQALSCVELVRVALQNVPDYETNFANFEAMIKKSKNLDPQMFYECPDFEIVYETRH